MVVLGCGGSGPRSGTSTLDPGQADASDRWQSDASGGGIVLGQDGSPPSGTSDLAIEGPSEILVTVAGEPPSLVVNARPAEFVARTGDGRSLQVGWSVDRGEVGSIDAQGIFTPTGRIGGKVTLTAGAGATRANLVVLVRIERTQNGSMVPVDLTNPAGYGGVGGEGPGGAVPDASLNLLNGPAEEDDRHTLLYPYSGTVWPRGLLAPLVQWEGDVSAIRFHLQTASGSFTYDGYFGRPAALGTGARFSRHPIAQDVWDAATESAGGDDRLTFSVTFLEGEKVLGPKAQTWIVAPGRLSGTVYYGSYGTQLVKNSDFVAQNGQMVGAAVLAIKPGEQKPVIAAGADSPPDRPGQGCRTCHSVSANGSRLLVGNDVWPYSINSIYDLGSQPPVETALTNAPDLFEWAGLSPDGRLALTNAVPIGTTPPTTTKLYAIDSAGTAGGPVELPSGLPSDLALATPVFSPDGTLAAGTLVRGTIPTIPADGSRTVVWSFDAAASRFSNPQSIFDLGNETATACLGFPSFLPTSKGLLLQKQLSPCTSGTYATYVGTEQVRSEIWWGDVTSGVQARLDALNGRRADGTSYLPKGASGTDHDDDTTLNYEPTVAPVLSGGYAWVVFTSRRMYGNVATASPFTSDPRYYDHTKVVTPKKLWVAAVDVGAKPGTDPSHPAFYLPAQELSAGNSRGYWVLDPCRSDGESCKTGDQCCGGYCQQDARGQLVCQSRTNTCSAFNERCTSAKDCCDPEAACINGFCSLLSTPLR